MFKDSNEFCLHLEKIKQEQQFDSFIETVIWFAENESDLEMEQIVKYLNKRFKDGIEYEARQMNMLKEKDNLISLF